MTLTCYVVGLTMPFHPPAQDDALRGTSMRLVAPASPPKPTDDLRSAGFTAPMALPFCSGCRIRLATAAVSLPESGQSESAHP